MTRFLRRKTSSPQAGFTLIEIIVVMVIIAILVTISTGSFMNAQRRGRDAKRKADVKQITNALEIYANDHPANGNYRYPSHSGSFELNGCGTVAIPTTCSWGAPFSQRGTGATTDTIYMVSLPSDPRPSTRSYHYEADPNGRWYILFARLENTEDQSVPIVGSAPGIYSGVSCGDIECNYAVSSANIRPESIKTVVAE